MLHERRLSFLDGLVLLLLGLLVLAGALVSAVCPLPHGRQDGQLRPLLLALEAVADGKEVHGLVEVLVPDVRLLEMQWGGKRIMINVIMEKNSTE